jgi:diguanylate cyclase (GGDEF)-like protein/PAS domain S-box-containing protein
MKLKLNLKDIHQNNFSLAKRFLIALCLLVIAFVLRYEIGSYFGGLGYLTFYPLMVITFFVCGSIAGTCFVILSILIVDYNFLPPFHSFSLTTFSNIANITFIFTSAFVGFIIYNLRKYIRQAEFNSSELNKSLEALSKTAKEVEDLYHRSPCGYHSLDQDGTIVEVNNTELALLGYRRDEFIGRKVLQFLTTESQTLFNQNFPKFIKTGKLQDLELDFIKKDGTTISFLVNANVVYDNDGQFVRTRSTLVDIHDQKALVNEVKTLNILFHELLESLPFGVVVFDQNRDVLYHNKQFGSLLNYPSRLLNQPKLNFADIIRFNWERGDYPGGQYEDILEDFVTKIINREFVLFEREQSNGVYLEVRGIPLSAGFTLITYTDITVRKANEIKVWRQANYDSLTDLPNRTLLFKRLAEQIASAKRSSKLVALLYLDLDGFKLINDTYGHEFGNEVLIGVTKRWNQCIHDTDFIARIGGDEFIVILGGLAVVEDATLIAQKLIDALDQPIILSNGALCKIGASIGISIYPNHTLDIQELIQAADTAMYKSKASAHNKITFWTPLDSEVS